MREQLKTKDMYNHYYNATREGIVLYVHILLIQQQKQFTCQTIQSPPKKMTTTKKMTQILFRYLFLTK